jgi:hypothetical protein
MVSRKSKKSRQSALINRIKDKYVAFSGKKTENCKNIPPSNNAEFFDFSEDIILLVKNRQYKKDKEVLYMKKEGDKQKSKVGGGKHTCDDDNSTNDLSFFEGAQEGFKMALQDMLGPKVMCTGSSNGSYSVPTYNGVSREVEASCVYDRPINRSHEMIEKDFSFLEGAQKGLKMVYSDVSSDLASYFQKK